MSWLIVLGAFICPFSEQLGESANVDECNMRTGPYVVAEAISRAGRFIAANFSSADFVLFEKRHRYFLLVCF